ncbi:MAG: 6-phosphogluconolactonase, partial [Prevotella sp.]
MDLNLSSHIVLNNIPERFYRPRTAVEQSEMTRCEKIHTEIFPKVEDGVRLIADAVEQEIKRCTAEGRNCVLGLGTGSSLTAVYTELVRRHRECGLSFSRVTVFNAYEYFPIAGDSRISSAGQLRKYLLDHVDIRPENVFSPDGGISQDEVVNHCRQYEQLIKQHGGIDIMLLGIGRMGNIATNEPGSTLTSASRIILIDPTSREEMTMSFGSQEPVPPCSITIGMSTILSARKVYVPAWGDEKSDIIQKTVEGGITDTIPASFLQTHNDATIVTDIPAAAKLTRMVHPWLVTDCEWTDKMIRSALVWLCTVTKKPILKLTNKDYNENGLSELLALFGSAYNANIKIFNDLQHTITGWPGGKPDADDTYRPERAQPYPKRVIVFSP